MRQAGVLRLPRCLAALAWLAQLALFYLGAPVSLSASGRRHGWRGGHPGAPNLLGLVLLLFGLTGIVWTAGLHISRFPRVVETPRSAPDYLLSEGPYLYSRNPMYLAGILTWLGWAVYYGSIWVLAAALSFWGFVVAIAVPLEERALESQSGEDYVRYKASAPRWLALPRRPGV